MNLDTSKRYFDTQGDFLMMKLPENCTAIVVNEVTNYLKPKVAEPWTVASRRQSST
jgi:hypothetical protein